MRIFFSIISLSLFIINTGHAGIVGTYDEATGTWHYTMEGESKATAQAPPPPPVPPNPPLRQQPQVTIKPPAGNYSYEYSEFPWGSSEGKICSIIKAKGIIPIIQKDSVVFKESIFDQPCTVGVVFTPLSKMLTGVTFEWQGRTVGRNLKGILENKYGGSLKPNRFMDKYYWPRAADDSTLVLEFEFSTTNLHYFGPQTKGYEIEERRAAERQNNGRF